MKYRLVGSRGLALISDGAGSRLIKTARGVSGSEDGCGRMSWWSWAGSSQEWVGRQDEYRDWCMEAWELWNL